MSSGEAFVTIVGLAAITVFTRTFFLLSDKELVLPPGSSAGSGMRRWPRWRPCSYRRS